MNLTYEKNGDYLIPTLQADIQPEGTVTKYGNDEGDLSEGEPQGRVLSVSSRKGH